MLLRVIRGLVGGRRAARKRNVWALPFLWNQFANLHVESRVFKNIVTFIWFFCGHNGPSCLPPLFLSVLEVAYWLLVETVWNWQYLCLTCTYTCILAVVNCQMRYSLSQNSLEYATVRKRAFVFVCFRLYSFVFASYRWRNKRNRSLPYVTHRYYSQQCVTLRLLFNIVL